MNDTFVCDWLLVEGVEDFIVLDKHPEVKCRERPVLELLRVLHLDLQVPIDAVHHLVQLPGCPHNSTKFTVLLSPGLPEPELASVPSPACLQGFHNGCKTFLMLHLSDTF